MKTYFTFLQRNKLFTFVNVIGLSISLMFLLLITHMVTRQLTVDKDMKDADFAPYSVTQFPALLVFENTKHIKTLQGEENIQKVVKSLSLDINSTIDSL
jgi:competence protein ComGC